MVRKILYYLFFTISLLLIVLSLLSLIHDVSFWFLQILDFPRLQYLVLGLVLVAAMVGVIKQWSWWNRALIAGLIIAVGIHSFMIFPYTRFAKKEVASVSNKEAVASKTFSIVSANVWQKNEHYDSFVKMIEDNQPDIVIATEINERWLEEIATLEQDYDYVVKRPYDNTYGMVLYSKFPLQDTKTLYLKNEKVPSIHTLVQLPGEKAFYLHAVHPVPPKPSKHPDNVGEKEIALVKVGNMVDDEKLPSVVAGDFNDVAWSKYSRLFKENGELNDVRAGRGFYNSFNAQSSLLRWPLDHVYVTNEFKVVDVQRLEKFGSDHFPYYVELVLP